MRAPSAQSCPASPPTWAGRPAWSWVQVALGGGGRGAGRDTGPWVRCPPSWRGSSGQARPPPCSGCRCLSPLPLAGPEAAVLCPLLLPAPTAAACTRSSQPCPQRPASRSGVCRETPDPQPYRPPISQRPPPVNATWEGRALSHGHCHRRCPATGTSGVLQKGGRGLDAGTGEGALVPVLSLPPWCHWAGHSSSSRSLSP